MKRRGFDNAGALLAARAVPFFGALLGFLYVNQYVRIRPAQTSTHQIATTPMQPHSPRTYSHART